MERQNSKTRRGRVGHGVAQTLTTSPQQGVVTVSYTRKHPPRESDVSACLQAAYYKGFSNHNPYPAVIERVERAPLKFLGRNQKNIEGDYAFCVDTAQTGGVKEEYTDGTLRIRKLTPKECFRLMDFDDADFEKAAAVNSNTQLYKQAGNSIVVAVAYHIIKALIDAGVFGGEAKEIELPEGQLSFHDIASFERYIEAYTEKENEPCGN